MKHHPDKGGDPNKFKEMTQAHAVLSDPEKRRNYDQFGEDGIDGVGNLNGNDIISQMFGSNHAQRGSKKGANVTHILCVKLEELYNGITKQLSIHRQVIDKSEEVRKCTSCNGNGFVVRTIRIGPMIQQMQSACKSCEGQGYLYSLKRINEVLNVHVRKGAVDGERIVFHNKANDIPGGDSGDIIVVLKETPHDVFRRRGTDLYISKNISLSEVPPLENY